MTIPSSLSLTALSTRLSRSAVLRGDAIPQELRDNGVEAVYLETQADSRFRVIFEGLRTSWRPSMQVAGTGELIADPSGSSTIRLAIRPKASSLWRVAITAAVLLALTWYNLIIDDPPNKLAWIVPVFIFVFFLPNSWIQVRMLR